MTEGRQKIAAEVRPRLQQYLDGYKTGIQLTKVNVQDAKPPREVQSAFNDVNKKRGC